MKGKRAGILAEALGQLEGDLVLDTLVWTGGRIRETSRILGVHHRTLYRIMRDRGIDPSRLPDREGYTYRTYPSGAPWSEA